MMTGYDVQGITKSKQKVSSHFITKNTHETYFYPLPTLKAEGGICSSALTGFTRYTPLLTLHGHPRVYRDYFV